MQSASHQNAENAITSAYEEATHNPEAAQTYAQIAIARALLAVAEQIAEYTDAVKRQRP